MVGYNFNKCIPLKDDNIITIDEEYIYLWNKTNLNSDNYVCTENKSSLYGYILDIIKINDKCLFFSQFKRLIFFSIESLKSEKIIKNIDCICKRKEEKNLILIKDCVLVNCIKGIAIISIKNKELIQYIENLDYFQNKKIYKSTDNYIYISNSFNYLFKFCFNEYNLKLVEKIKINDPDGETLNYNHSVYSDNSFDNYDKDVHLNEYNIIIKENYIYIWNHSIYRVINDEDSY